MVEHDADWAAPLFRRSEFRNIPAGCMRRNTITFEAARDLQLEAGNLPAGAEHEVDSRPVQELVRDSDCFRVRQRVRGAGKDAWSEACADGRRAF